MKAWFVAVALVGACTSGTPAVKQPAAAKVTPPAAPTVGAPTVLAHGNGKPPFLLLVDDTGTVRLAAAASWADLDAGKLTIASHAGELRTANRYVREQVALGNAPMTSIAGWDTYTAAPDDDATSGDPPPPEDEEDDDDATYTIIEPNEALMGKKDSDRAEGVYRRADDPERVREEARLARERRFPPALPPLHDPLPLNPDGTPSRLAQIVGGVDENSTLDPFSAMVIVSPTTKATRLIAAVRDTEAAIAVSSAGKLRPLRLQFGVQGFAKRPRYWLEARVTSNGLVIEAVPDAPIEITALDAAQLAAAIDKARTTRGAKPDAPVDVLVDADVDAQRLVDVLVALDVAGVRTIGLGAAPTGEQLTRRGHRIPSATTGWLNAQGALDKAEIRRVVTAQLASIKACYTTALAANAALAGSVQTQFFIRPDGKVASAVASGIDRTVSTCIADVVRKIEFPAPPGGGGVQVNYQLKFRP